MKKLFFTSFLFLFFGCSSVIVYSPKYVFIKGNNNDDNTITGADLEGQLDQKSDGNVDLPLVP